MADEVARRDCGDSREEMASTAMQELTLFSVYLHAKSTIVRQITLHHGHFTLECLSASMH